MFRVKESRKERKAKVENVKQEQERTTKKKREQAGGCV
jgi:hypothetical protein